MVNTLELQDATGQKESAEMVQDDRSDVDTVRAFNEDLLATKQAPMRAGTPVSSESLTDRYDD